MHNSIMTPSNFTALHVSTDLVAGWQTSSYKVRRHHARTFLNACRWVTSKVIHITFQRPTGSASMMRWCCRLGISFSCHLTPLTNCNSRSTLLVTWMWSRRPRGRRHAVGVITEDSDCSKLFTVVNYPETLERSVPNGLVKWQTYYWILHLLIGWLTVNFSVSLRNYTHLPWQAHNAVQ